MVNFVRCCDETRRKKPTDQAKDYGQCLAGVLTARIWASSINTICAARDVSKGIIYHYFKSKDDLFLACVEECFQLLTDYLKTNLQFENLTLESVLKPSK